jgi:hypothetical protein
MSDSHVIDQKSKIQLRILKGGHPGSVSRQGGIPPDEKMPPGRYKLVCESARLTQKWSKTVAEFSFRVVEGDHFGVMLSAWIFVYTVAGLVYPGKYTTACSIALGHETGPDDDLSPEAVFVGKIFWGEVGFRSASTNNRRPEDSSQKKDSKDFLRVRSVLSLAEL